MTASRRTSCCQRLGSFRHHLQHARHHTCSSQRLFQLALCCLQHRLLRLLTAEHMATGPVSLCVPQCPVLSLQIHYAAGAVRCLCVSACPVLLCTHCQLCTSLHLLPHTCLHPLPAELYFSAPTASCFAALLCTPTASTVRPCIRQPLIFIASGRLLMWKKQDAPSLPAVYFSAPTASTRLCKTYRTHPACLTCMSQLRVWPG